MNKSDLVSKLTERLGGDRSIATAAVNGVLEEIESSVARGERVSLFGFGTFDRRERAPRTGRNPQTGATIQLAASVAPVFRPGAGFRSRLALNGGSAAVTAAVPSAPPKGAAPKKKSEKKSAVTRDAGKGGKKAKQAAKKDADKAGDKAAKKAAKKAR
ncbi:HU family DNA-binding protein [Blastococcus sp. CT_GayMR16]|uniref:HU family DNA-binding protein n=1 Tax=Blastococcus sp. CT_GayMR16 TaxID=2559607 RepID=UPI00142FC1C0|nr:HU family DNA-binding protein [Blastococcus sp. CT_GayMR16]